MDYLHRIEHNIIKNFPNITPDEYHTRMQLIRHMIAIMNDKNKLRLKEAVNG